MSQSATGAVTIKRSNEAAQAPGKRGGQPTHGLYEVRRQVAELTPDDHDSELAKAMTAIRLELAAQLGGRRLANGGSRRASP
jgi:hypothetical protein